MHLEAGQSNIYCTRTHAYGKLPKESRSTTRSQPQQRTVNALLARSIRESDEQAY